MPKRSFEKPCQCMPMYGSEGSRGGTRCYGQAAGVLLGEAAGGLVRECLAVPRAGLPPQTGGDKLRGVDSSSRYSSNACLSTVPHRAVSPMAGERLPGRALIVLRERKGLGIPQTWTSTCSQTASQRPVLPGLVLPGHKSRRAREEIERERERGVGGCSLLDGPTFAPGFASLASRCWESLLRLLTLLLRAFSE